MKADRMLPAVTSGVNHSSLGTQRPIDNVCIR